MQVLAEVLPQSVAIARNPGFHASGHEQHLFITGTRRSRPTGLGRADGPRVSLIFGNGVFAIDQACAT